MAPLAHCVQSEAVSLHILLGLSFRHLPLACDPRLRARRVGGWVGGGGCGGGGGGCGGDEG